MKRLSRYVAKEYAIMVVVAYGSLLLLFSIFELAEFARQAAIARREFGLALELTAWNLAVISAEVGPLSALVAAVLVGTSMARRGEVTAVLAAGISPLRLLLPVAFVCALFSVGMYAVVDRVMPKAVSEIDRIMMDELGRRSYAAQYFSMPRQWFKAGDKFVRVSEIDARTQTYYGVQILELELGRVRRKIHAERVVALMNELVAQESTVETYPRAEGPKPDEITFTKEREMILPLQHRFNLSLNLSTRPTKLGLSELESVFQMRRRIGYDPRLYENEFYSRVLFPFVIVLLTLLGATFAFVPQAKRSFVMAILELLGLTLLAFVLRQSLRSLANGGFVSPQMGAIGPAIALLVFVLYRLRRALLPLRG